ncbi:type II toxin-antitoxin system VapC family toxin [Mycetohabitans rhizoxinica]|uniref:type II toxin-antitoxin system VapC family toxin n=1 Tax=Mycetohabitans rhizoxinica TaxID=412963 RepID=UPI0030CFF7EC
MTQLYMLDTNICSFIIRERPLDVLVKMQACVDAQQRIVISAITYAQVRYGSIGKKASPKHAGLASAFVARLDGILPWDAAAVDETTRIRVELAELGTPIGNNDAAIAGHALVAGAVLATNNVREFKRVRGLPIEDWVA